MGDIHIFGRRHMAGGTGGGSRIILAYYPFGRVYIHLVPIGPERDTMFGLIIDLKLGMIRTKVALTAHFRSSGLLLGEPVPGVTGRARTLGAVRIDTTDTGVGPGSRIQ